MRCLYQKTVKTIFSQGGHVTVWRMPTEISQSRLAGRYKPSNACTIIAVKLIEYIYREGIILRPTRISLASKRNGVRSHPRFRKWPSKIFAEFERTQPIMVQILFCFPNCHHMKCTHANDNMIKIIDLQNFSCNNLHTSKCLIEGYNLKIFIYNVHLIVISHSFI